MIAERFFGYIGGAGAELDVGDGVAAGECVVVVVESGDEVEVVVV